MIDKITNPPSQKDLIDKVNELVDDKQDVLVSGTNIKTINNTSILGSGNIDIQGGGSNRNIGEIVASTIPLSDAGLHLLDGAVISGDGVYGDFYNYIASIVNTYPQIFCQEHEWQAEVVSHGVCGKFVFYEPNRTVRLPKITGFTEGTNDLTVLGVLTQAGVPNITSGDAKVLSWKSDTQFSWTEGALQSNETVHGGLQNNTGNWLGSVVANFDASRSSSIYGNSSTVQPQSIKVLFYICIATSTKTDIQVDINEIVTDLNGKANIDLSNITSEGKNIANWSTNVTNCITEIPQDIKLELNDGVLTLKAGSKVYKPDNSFIEVANDISVGYGIAVSGLVAVLTVNQKLYFAKPQYVTSGNTAPTTRNERQVWYDTTANIVKMYAPNSSNFEEVMLPIAIVSSSGVDNKFASIDQVFNGFGYIGSTVYALPGVKGLIPNGRNEDGSLKNIEFTVDSVKTVTRTWVDNNNQVWGYIKNPPAGAAETWYWNGYIESDEEPSYNEYIMWYKPSENITYMNNGAQSSTPNWEKVNYINFGKASGINSQEIKIFTTKTAFHAVDYNDVVLKQDLATVHCVVETYKKGSSWYRVYDDGWCEQGGHFDKGSLAKDTSNTIGLLKSFVDINYTLIALSNRNDNSAGSINNQVFVIYRTTNSFIARCYGDGNSQYIDWQACGYIS